MASSQDSIRKLRLGKCPFQFVAPGNNADICRDFLGYRELDGIVRSEPEGWIFCGRYVKDGHADRIYNFDIRDNDVWILSYPKSGRKDSDSRAKFDCSSGLVHFVICVVAD